MIKIFLICLILANLGIFQAARTTNTKKSYTISTLASSTSTKHAPSKHNFTVIKVADGDTITVRNNTDRNLVRIRFLCIDAPEKSQPKWGAESLKKLAELLPLNSDVKLSGEKIDLYGRTVAEVINHKGINVNKNMVELGMVVHYPFQKGCNMYQYAETLAKHAKLGVWSDPKFELPWDYRTRMGIGVRGKSNTTSTTTITKTTNKDNSKTYSSNSQTSTNSKQMRSSRTKS